MSDQARIDDIEMMVTLAQGNPGAFRVLVDICDKNVQVFRRVGMQFHLTDSKSYALWEVYKDICKFDIDKTIEYLDNWACNTIIPLQHYVQEKS